MKRDLARSLLILVNDKQSMSELDSYIQYRIEVLRDNLEASDVASEFNRGALSELRRFRHLREEVIKDAE